MYDHKLKSIIAAAVSRLEVELGRGLPHSTQPVQHWLRQLSKTARPEDYFQHPIAFPALLLPWWLETHIHGAPDETLQAELVYSTINGYYYIRLIDNLMDDHATVEQGLLPALNFFYLQFQRVYQVRFPNDHTFWEFFASMWLRSADVAMYDARISYIDEAHFKQVSAQKVCAAKIPVSATCHLNGRLDLIEPWGELVDLFGIWHQMYNDLFDWYKDYTHQTVTYFLSEADRCRQPDESVAAWVAREGFHWGIDQLQAWMAELVALAKKLRSPDLLAYLETREKMVLKKKAKVEPALRTVAKLGRVLP